MAYLSEWVRRSGIAVLFFLELTVSAAAQIPTEEPSPDYPAVLREWLNRPAGARLIDFSYAGYRCGEGRPSIRDFDLPRFDVTDFGAIPDDGLDDIEAMQRALDAAAAAGGGIVRVPPGRYDFDVDASRGFLRIRHSNIILLGSGEGPDGTTIFDHAPSPTPDPAKPWLAGLFPSFVAVGAGDLADETSPLTNPANRRTRVFPAARGDLSLQVAHPEQLEVGQTYLLTQQEAPDSSLVRALTAPLSKVGSRHLDTSGAGALKMQLMVRIVSMEGDRIRLDAPLLMSLEERWQPTLWAIPGLLRNVAVVGFRITNDWSEEFHHHLNGEHDNGYTCISFHYVENCWAQALISYNSSVLVSLSYAKNCSVFDGQIRGIPGHNGFTVGGASTRNLIYNCRAGNSMHSFSIQSYASGNVFYNNNAEEPSAIDLHSGLGMSNLFDNIFGPAYQHGGNADGLPPVLGRGQVFWHWKVGRFEPYKGRVKNSVWNGNQLPAFTAVGVGGLFGQPLYYEVAGVKHYDDMDSPQACVERFNAPPGNPVSLFLFQRERRLGREQTWNF